MARKLAPWVPRSEFELGDGFHLLLVAGAMVLLVALELHLSGRDGETGEADSEIFILHMFSPSFLFKMGYQPSDFGQSWDDELFLQVAHGVRYVCC